MGLPVGYHDPVPGMLSLLPTGRPLDLRKPGTQKARQAGSPFMTGQSYYIDADREDGTWSIVVHDGPPQGAPTRQIPPGKSRYDSSGRVAVCPFCRPPTTAQVQMRSSRRLMIGH